MKTTTGAAWVALGGTLGVALRALLAGAFPTAAGAFPWTTFTINVIGSFLLGALVEMLGRGGPEAGWRRVARLGCGTGLLGGFTTYSTFAVEILDLLSTGEVLTGLGYAVVSVVTGVGAAVGGIVLVRRRAGERR